MKKEHEYGERESWITMQGPEALIRAAFAKVLRW
jgi:hypothetical protein